MASLSAALIRCCPSVRGPFLTVLRISGALLRECGAHGAVVGAANDGAALDQTGLGGFSELGFEDGVGFSQVRPDAPEVFWTKGLPSYLAADSALNCKTVLNWDGTMPIDKLTHHAGGDVKNSCHFGLRANNVASYFERGFLCFHPFNLA